MRKHRRSRFGFLAIVAIAAAFTAVPAVAIAQDSVSDPSSAQYDTPIPGGTEGAAAAGQSSSGGGESGLSSNIGSLPFTGMDLLIVLGVALVLTGSGFALRRLSMPPGPRV